MKAQKFESALEQMVGKLYNYQKQNHRILRYEIKETSIKLVTDLKDIVILEDDISEVLDSFTHIETQEDGIMGVSIKKSQTIIGGTSVELKNIVMENIRNIQKDKSYIPQANAINDGIRSMIDLAKTEVEMLKAINSFRK